MDFYQIKQKHTKNGIEVYPDFCVNGQIKDIMVRGKNFYAIWDAENNIWSTDEFDVQKIVDRELDEYAKTIKTEEHVTIKYMKNFSSNSWIKYRSFVNNVSDIFKPLDSIITFSDTKVKKTDYVSKRLPYPLQKCDIPNYTELITTLYDEEERQKLEWAIGAIISGDSKRIQKFIVLYGSAGAGKSTVLNIIDEMFKGYSANFEAKALTSSENSFSTAAFKTNPLIAIQHDGDLSVIKDNSTLNSIVSHETISIHEKYEKAYPMKINSFLFMGTNKPVKITDAKSGVIRRLIDVKPSGRILPIRKYDKLMRNIKFEFGGIAYHCLEVYKKLGASYYDTYKPVDMMYKTDPFFNFVEDCYDVFKRDDCTSLRRAYQLYKTYCDDTGATSKLQMYKFREELKNYFKKYSDRVKIDGKDYRSFYSGFLWKKFEQNQEPKKEETNSKWIDFDSDTSVFDELYSDCYAQYAVLNKSGNEIPGQKWDKVKTKLRDLNTTKLHYVKMPEDGKHIVVDFDIKDEDGNKSLELNLEAANKFPKTYAELSKSEAGIHLHYIYTGDIEELSRVYDDNIEIKVFTGNSSLRRKLTKCNNEKIATISSGLPLKQKGDKMINHEVVQNEQHLKRLIEKNLRKEIHPGTKPSIDFIYKILEDAYASGLKYDVTDMRQDIFIFASQSSHQAEYCIKLVDKMKFKSEASIEPNPEDDYDKKEIVFFDVEVFPNLFIICWKIKGKPTVIKMINPTPLEVEDLMQMKLVGFNNRKYDNHILYARMCGFNNKELFNLSQKIISNSKNACFANAYNASYTDVYDFSSKKQSLKKFEIELGLDHVENEIPWDQPVPEELWSQIAEYCANDVIATEAVFENRYADFEARCVLADIAGGTPNDTTNSLTTKLIFGNNKTPQDEFEYYNMGKVTPNTVFEDEFTAFDEYGRAIFPGYLYEKGKSTYRGDEIGEGGRVFAQPGIHVNVKTLDITSMHPHSIKALNLFGDRYTERFYDLVRARVAIKHKDFEALKDIFDGAFTRFVGEDDKILDNLAFALKIAINSVYGLTAAKFDNPFRDARNVDNIVAKRGALFMTNLLYKVLELGGDVVHIKTDSIKVANITPELEQFICEYGRKYGYEFEVESEYEKMFLANDAVYVAYEKDKGWTATGTQFQVPYVFKALFSKEPIIFDDLCVTNSVTSAMYLDLNEDLPDVSAEEKELSKLESKYKKGELSDIMFEESCKPLNDIIATGHNYNFVGKVGRFCPMVDGSGGGLLVRENKGKYGAVTGTKGYRWMEANVVKNLGKEDLINKDYFNTMVDKAVEAISNYGDIEQFLA